MAKQAQRVDRRVQRTRQLLQDALIAMMIDKGYEATTVQDIIDRANLGRATFYAFVVARTGWRLRSDFRLQRT